MNRKLNIILLSKIGHALRDADAVRQKQARKRTEGKRAIRKKPSAASTKSPVGDAQLQAIFHSNQAENMKPLKSALTPKQSEVESSLLQEKQLAVGSRTEARAQLCSCCCNCQNNHIHEQRQGKQDKTADLSFDGLTLKNMLLKKFVPLHYKKENTPSVLQDIDDIITTERPLTPFSPPDIEPLPMAYAFSMDEEDVQSLSSLCDSLDVVGGDASSTGFDEAFSAVFPEFADGADDNADLDSMDWVF